MKQTTWHYGLVKHLDGSLGVHEIYTDGEHLSWTENPVAFFGESKEEILKILKLVERDVKKFKVIDSKQHESINYQRGRG